jgi:UDP-glucose 4-epimerase
MKKRILITGGAGYIGSHVNRTLAESGYDTVVYDNLSTGHRDFVKWGSFIEGDLADTSLLSHVLSSMDIGAVIHLAASIESGESARDPEKFYANNLINTHGLLGAMLANDIRFLVFSSTAAVYGNPETDRINEKHPLNPVSPYGRTKLAVEFMLKDYSAAYDLKYASLRYFNAAGADPASKIGEAHTPETHLIPLAISAALSSNASIKIFGSDFPTKDGTCIRDYIHVNDIASAHLLAMKYLFGGGSSDVFNLGNGFGYSVREVIDTVKDISGINFDVHTDGRRTGDAHTLVADNSKAAQILGWTPSYTSLRDIIKTALEWHRRKSI